MPNFEWVVTFAAAVLAERVAFRWAKYDLVPWIRWLQGNEIPGDHAAEYLKYLRKYGM